MKKATKAQWIKFSLVSIIYILFTLWVGNFWLLLGLPVLFDIYISKYIPWGAWKESKNPAVRKLAGWVDAILFALIAVYMINLFVFQNYKIPTSSLEKSLLVGDYLFVSKLSYGPRVPNTPLSFPLAQHTMPIFGCKSYLDWLQWDYHRLKGFGKVKRNDIVVFNFPAGDTVALNMQQTDFYSLCDMRGRDAVISDKAIYGDIVYRPVDRRENYVKRCVGMPGDSLQVVSNDLYIDGKKQAEPKHAQLNYFVETNGNVLNDKQFRTLSVSEEDRYLVNNESNAASVFEAVGIKPSGSVYNPVYIIPLTRSSLDLLKRSGWAKTIIVEPDIFGGYTYPGARYDTGWTRDNFGPIWIPKRGATIELNEKNLALYSRCIINYEGNTLRQEGDKLYINDKLTTSFTFKYDYYFMMGDNRHKSADSRSWGFVPEDHIVGKPILVEISIDKDRGLFNGGFRWNRLFKWVGNI